MPRVAPAGAATVLLLAPVLAVAQPRIELGDPRAAAPERPSSAQSGTPLEGSNARPTNAPELEAPAAPRDFAAQNPLGVEILHAYSLPLHLPVGGGSFALQLGLSYRIADHLAVGLGSMAFGAMGDSAGNFSVMLDGRPYLEGFVFVHRHVQLYAQVGALILGRTASGLVSGGMRVSVDLRAGARFWIRDWLTVGLQLGLGVVTTRSPPSASVAYRAGTVIGYSGLTIGFHL